MKTVNIFVTGRVQGVYFRAYTRKQAEIHHVKGWVRNLADGRVEILAQADEERLDLFINWCHKGPMLAKVNEVNVFEQPTREVFATFEIR